MNSRSTSINVVFSRPFRLPEMDGAYPAGTYEVVTDEEAIEGNFTLAYRRVGTSIHLHRQGSTEVLTIDPRQLALAIAADLAGGAAQVDRQESTDRPNERIISSDPTR